MKGKGLGLGPGLGGRSYQPKPSFSSGRAAPALLQHEDSLSLSHTFGLEEPESPESRAGVAVGSGSVAAACAQGVETPATVGRGVREAEAARSRSGAASTSGRAKHSR